MEDRLHVRSQRLFAIRRKDDQSNPLSGSILLIVDAPIRGDQSIESLSFGCPEQRSV
jgi:hypothetical protein